MNNSRKSDPDGDGWTFAPFRDYPIGRPRSQRPPTCTSPAPRPRAGMFVDGSAGPCRPKPRRPKVTGLGRHGPTQTDTFGESTWAATFGPGGFGRSIRPDGAKPALAGRADQSRPSRTCPPGRGPSRPCRICPHGGAEAALAERVRPDKAQDALAEFGRQSRPSRTCPPGGGQASLAERGGQNRPSRTCPLGRGPSRPRRMCPQPNVSAPRGPSLSRRTCRPKPPEPNMPARKGPKPPSPNVPPGWAQAARAERVRPEGAKPLSPNVPAKTARAEHARSEGAQASLAERAGQNRPSRICPLGRGPSLSRRTCRPKPPEPNMPARKGPKPPSPNVPPGAERVRPEGAKPLSPNVPAKTARAEHARSEGAQAALAECAPRTCAPGRGQAALPERAGQSVDVQQGGLGGHGRTRLAARQTARHKRYKPCGQQIARHESRGPPQSMWPARHERGPAGGPARELCGPAGRPARVVGVLGVRVMGPYSCAGRRSGPQRSDRRNSCAGRHAGP